MTNNKDNKRDMIAPIIAITMLPEIKNAAKNPITTPPNKSIICIDEPSSPSPVLDLALSVSFIEAIIVGISFIAPIIPPQSIIPAPIYFT